MKRILVISTHNACRSQMTEAYLRHLTDEKFEIHSAGLEPTEVDELAVAVMQEDGIDLSRHATHHLDDFSHLVFDYAITVCDNANMRCQQYPNQLLRFHQNFPDLSLANGTDEEILMQYRTIRNRIKFYCEELVNTRFNQTTWPFELPEEEDQNQE